ncbi:MAG: hypothetical protein EAY75_01140, partial [Bacteroidetes bacterium]
MTITLMQPYFFPYLGYFSLIDRVDDFIFFDTVQVTRQTWMTRNRILKQNGIDWNYIMPELPKQPLGTTLLECRLQSGSQWKQKLVGQLQQYKGFANHYKATMALMEEILHVPHTTLVDFNIDSTIKLARYLGLSTHFSRLSTLGISYEAAEDAGKWGLQISKAVGATVFINPVGGQTLLDAAGFKQAGIALGFVENQLSAYPQGSSVDFVPGLSLIDALMCCGK